MAGPRKSARARKPATRKTTDKNASPARARKPRSPRRKSAASKDIVKALVAARDPGERRARSGARRVQADKSGEDRGFAQALRGTQFTSQGRRLSLRALDVDILYQPRRQGLAENPTRPLAARQDRAEAPVSSRVTPSLRGASETSEPGMTRTQAARILAMKRSSSWRNRVLSLDSVRAEFSTSSDADPVSVAPRLTLVILAAAWLVPWATL
jgi:hypothetical protein